ncbi:Translation elongation factor 1 beta [Ascosphaera atra]|nr:Translation elongation factor 1 beta [Ascosphaera atra]
MGFHDLSTEAGVAVANTFFLSKSYVEGHQPTQADVATFKAFTSAPDAKKYPFAARWYKHIASYEPEFSTLPGDASKPYTEYGPENVDIPVIPAKGGDDDDEDLFGSDSEEEDPEVAAEREKRLNEYKAKKAKKPKVAAKSLVTMEVKPWGMFNYQHFPSTVHILTIVFR